MWTEVVTTVATPTLAGLHAKVNTPASFLVTVEIRVAPVLMICPVLLAALLGRKPL